MLENTYETTVYLTERLIGFAILLQTIEYFQIRKTFGNLGIWTWREIGKEFQRFWYPLPFVFNFLLGDRNFPVLIFLRFVATVGALVFPSALLWAFVLLTTILIAMRWRGTFNGGSDYMSVIVLMSLVVCRAWNEVNPIWMMIVLGYLAVQVCLSYFVAGFAKLRHLKWRNGEAVYGFLTSNYYGSPALFRNLKNPDRRFFKAIGWGIIAFECTFPLALINPSICVFMMIAAFIFHVLNAYLYGLNRFVWVWLSGYPALYWCSRYLAR